MAIMHKIWEATSFIKEKTDHQPTIGLILGSGLGGLADEIEEAVSIPYADIPYFATSSAIGHANKLVIGKLEGQTIVAMKGRYHFYEGYSLEEVTFPVRVMKALGIEDLIITNACGAVNEEFSAGELMIITDHLNLTGRNPLIGPNNAELGTRFPDLTKVYDKVHQETARAVAAKHGFSLREGVYAWWSGPTYETPAEIRMMRTLGADAVGMSTVPEVIVAAHGGMKVLGISCLTNMAAGILDQPLSHDEVIEVAAQARTKFVNLVKGVLKEI